jgi:hypothetical protein
MVRRKAKTLWNGDDRGEEGKEVQEFEMRAIQAVREAGILWT